MFGAANAFAKCNTMALDTTSCPNVAVHNSFEAQNPSRWQHTYSARTYLNDAVAEWLSNATSARERFGPISAWDVSAITDMSRLFHGKSGFDEDISAWDVSKVTNMREMFRGATSFDQPLGSWQVGQVTDFYATFYQASAMNQDISGWNVSQANHMRAMFGVRSSRCPPPASCSLPPVAHRLTSSLRLGRAQTPCPTPTSCSFVARGRAPRPSPLLAMARAGVWETAPRPARRTEAPIVRGVRDWAELLAELEAELVSRGCFVRLRDVWGSLSSGRGCHLAPAPLKIPNYILKEITKL